MSRKSHLEIAKYFWKSHLKGKGVVLDATCGNGKDTLFLAQEILMDAGSQIFALDIQKIALKNTQKLLEKFFPKNSLKKIRLQKISHHLFEPPKKFDLIVYNLGYLPYGDKSITTQKQTTLLSLHKALSWLNSNGALSITCYPGHPEGFIETKEVLSWAQKLDFQKYLTIQHRSLNRENAPCFVWIQAL